MNKVVEILKKNKNIKQPEWAPFVKTGVHKERVPTQDDWWYLRAASVLRKVYLNGPIGTNRLAKKYGGKKNRGVRPDKKFSGSRNITRKVLQQLNAAGLIKSVDKPSAGKMVTKEGNDLLKQVK